MFQNVSLRAKAIGFAIALSTFPVLGIGAVAYYFANRAITQDVMQLQQGYAVELADKLSRFMFERYGDIQAIANLAILTDPKVSSIVPKNLKEDTLNRYVKIYHVYDNITIFDLRGNVILKSQSGTIQNPSNKEYFQQVISTGKPVVSSPEFSPSTSDLVVYLAAPIKNTLTGKTIGIARSRLPIQHIKERITSLNNAEQQAHVIDGSGKIFVARSSREIGQEIELEYPFFRQLKADKQTEARIVFSQLDKTDKVLTIALTPTLAGMSNLNWTVLIDSDTDIAFRAQTNLLRTILIGCVVTALAVSAIAATIANRTAKSINVIVSTITTSTTQIASTIDQQERTATHQAASVNQTTSTMTELGASSKTSAEQAESSAENARQILALAESSAAGASQVLNLAERGTQTVERTLDGISTLKEKVEAIAEQIMRLNQQVNQIGNIINIVSDLANQTNMLALNAAVEAVRAGEHGKGFGVVAAEIRKLADQSKRSAEKINALVADIQSAVNSTVMVTDEGRKTAEIGIQLSQETADAFTSVTEAINEIVLSKQQASLSAINKIVVSSQQISLTAQQQAIAIQQVVEAMNSINQGAVQTANGITQTKIGIQKLNEVAQNLKAIV